MDHAAREGESAVLAWTVSIRAAEVADGWVLNIGAVLQGDARDMALMGLSIAVLVYISMHLYNVYAMLYYAAGLKPIAQFLP